MFIIIESMAKKRRASAAEKARLKALRKRYGLGEFKRSSRRVSAKRTRSTPMAKKRRSVSRKGITSGLQKPLVSGITYALVNPIVSQFLGKFNVGVQDELVQIVAALALKSMTRNAIISNWANAAIIVNTAQLASGISGNIFQTSTTSISTQTNVIG
tara:strand:+ start:124 stop:594 length:471 start_codon:yes stop_codon:yes gene_type:complete